MPTGTTSRAETSPEAKNSASQAPAKTSVETTIWRGG